MSTAIPRLTTPAAWGLSGRMGGQGGEGSSSGNLTDGVS